VCAVACLATIHTGCGNRSDESELPLQLVADVPLPGTASRLDYASVDPARHRLFFADLGDGQLTVVDTLARRVVRRVRGVPSAHGALVVPKLRRVYVTATESRQLVTVNERTYQILARTPTGDFPDGIAYDPSSGSVFVSNKVGGSETVIDATSGRVLGTVPLGGAAGNVQYDPVDRRMLVNVQSRGEVAAIDPMTLGVERRIPVGGDCAGNHGLLVDSPARLAFIACEDNARLVVLDLRAERVTASFAVGDQPDVLAFDPGLQRVYVAAESGVVAVFGRRGRTLDPLGTAFLADGAHTVAVDPRTHEVFFPLPDADGVPVVRIMARVDDGGQPDRDLRSTLKHAPNAQSTSLEACQWLTVAVVLAASLSAASS